MSDGKKGKPTYQPPALMPLGELAKGDGQFSCHSGSSASDCQTGGTASNNCHVGNSAQQRCRAGSGVTGNCRSGFLALNRCSSGFFGR
jgi:hypothetical protein